jgi:osmotically inducible lipoprotein OsmB
MKKLPIVGMLVVLSLSACGTQPSDRALSGGGIGAAGGAVIGALGGAPLAGALVGGAAGAAAGALTSPNQVDLGRPAWK